MRTVIALSILLLGGMSSGLVYAGASVMPVKIEAKNGGQWVTQMIASWTEDDNTINPCYGESECYIGPDVMYTDGSPSLYGSCNNSLNCIEISKYHTAKEVMEAYRTAFGVPHEVSFKMSTGKTANCVGLFYIPHAVNNGQLDAQVWPNSTCGIVPPANQTCTLTIPSSMDFGTLKRMNLRARNNILPGK